MNALSPRFTDALVRSTALSPATDPDAELHRMIAEFRANRTAAHVEWDAFSRLAKRHPDYKPRMQALLAGHQDQARDEKRIALAAPLTLAGAQAKAQLGYDMLAGDDPQSHDLLHDHEGPCRMWSVALAGTRDLVRLTGGLCGETWDSPDRELLEAYTEFRDGMGILEAHGEWRCGNWAKHPQVAELDREMHLLRDCIIEMPAITSEGRSAKAAVALHYLAEEFADRVGEEWAEKVIRAAEAGLGNAVVILPLPAASGSYVATVGDAA